MLLGLLLGGAIATGSLLLSRFLSVPVELLLASSVGIPFAFALPVLLGELQGEERFAGYAMISTGQAGLKLLAAIGAWLGWQLLPVVILLSAVVGSVVGIALIAFGGRSRQTAIPFGPYLAAAGFIALLWGGNLVQLYRAWFFR